MSLRNATIFLVIIAGGKNVKIQINYSFYPLYVSHARMQFEQKWGLSFKRGFAV